MCLQETGVMQHGYHFRDDSELVLGDIKPLIERLNHLATYVLSLVICEVLERF